MKYSWFSVRFKIHLHLFPWSWRHRTSSIKDTRACRMLLYVHRKRTAVWIHYYLLGLQLLNLLAFTNRRSVYMPNPFRNIHLTYNMRERASAQNHAFSFLRKVRLLQVIYTLSASRPTYYSWSHIIFTCKQLFTPNSLLATVKWIIWA